MVQALQKIIELGNYREGYLKEIFSKFKCVRSESKASKDVMSFLINDAIDAERKGLTRTYLILKDEEWAKGKIAIDGYFSLALKILYFSKDINKNILKMVFGDYSRKNCPAYLIAQIARAENSARGTGAIMFKIALQLIAKASDIVGGSLIYLDCVPEKETYYSNYGFKFLQVKHNSELIQMYQVI